eukprot:CAMPEP_0181116108 /NCGR_PEP_ID=MMETSP1071-20121207/21776_1 /TAXON_ID=35127 /ORGANISM="Thalassiosira sp., Strain NH16" /LENGTH=78 /DNA_ID=CAMNT_0023200333 /DNA_START=55 /DNA_END=291 /DNA_ORIENTATION=+
MASPPTSGNSSGFKNPFASGLGRSGRMGAWAAAIGIVAAWNYYDSQKNTSESFSKEEQQSWNAAQKKKTTTKVSDQSK